MIVHCDFLRILSAGRLFVALSLFAVSQARAQYDPLLIKQPYDQSRPGASTEVVSNSGSAASAFQVTVCPLDSSRTIPYFYSHSQEDFHIYKHDYAGKLLYHKWSISSSSGIVFDAETYTYNDSGKIATRLLEKFMGRPGFVFLERNTYSPAGDLVMVIGHVKVDTVWTPRYGTRYEYDAGRHLTQVTNLKDLNLVPFSRISYTYSENGQVLTEITQSIVGTESVNVSATSYTYNAHGNEIERVSYLWENFKGWVPDYETSKTYEVDLLKTVTTRFWSLDEWMFVSKILLFYEPSGKVIRRVSQDSDGETWKDIYEYNYEYDGRGLLLKVESGPANARSSSRGSYTYDERGNVLSELLESRGTFSDVWKVEQITDNYYDCRHLPLLKNEVRVFPIPANQQLLIATPAPVDCRLFDLQGNLLMESRQVDKLDVSVLQSGIYILEVMESGKSRYMTKIVKD